LSIWICDHQQLISFGGEKRIKFVTRPKPRLTGENESARSGYTTLFTVVRRDDASQLIAATNASGPQDVRTYAG